MITEDQVEQLCLRWFQDTGWSYRYGPELAPEGETPERGDLGEVLLKGRLAEAVQALNPQLPAEAVEEVVQVVARPSHPGLVPNNRDFLQLLRQGVRVTYTRPDGVKTTDHAFLIDYEQPHRNDWLVVNQFTLLGVKMSRRPDVVVFVNGMPLAVIELKNPADPSTDIWAAFNQLQTYKDETPDLFVYNQALVISDGFLARVGSLTASKEWFLPWHTLKNEHDRPRLEYQLEKIVKGFFDPALFLDYLRHFILFEQDGHALIKKIAGYHQFHGVREAVAVTLIAKVMDERSGEARASYRENVVPGSGKAGVFWHTQGSGKSISMVFYAGKLLQQPEMKNPTLVVVTDRNNLDGQLFEQFARASDLLKQSPQQADSREDLRTMLGNRQSGGIIFTTVQKFSLLDGETVHPELCNRSNVVVISDEAHRSQYGLEARLNQKTGAYLYGYAKYLRDALPAASFIGFTGTPIALEDKNTRSVFGDYVSVYDIQDAVDDQATVPIYYESRLARIDINRAEIDTINRDVDEVVEAEEDLAAREKTKSNWAVLAKLVGTEARIQEVAQDLIDHYETRTQTFEGKAMIVCMQRDICVSLFDALIALRPEWAGTRLQKHGQLHGYNPDDGTVRIVMTGDASDPVYLQNHVYTKSQKKQLERRFKDPADPLKLVIIRDMWLTGFDAPCCHTLYVDKPMRGHNLMQAIARVNRVFKDKPGGLVVDYIGIGTELKVALKDYTNAKGRGTPTLDIEEALDQLLSKLDALRSLFHGFDYQDYETNALGLLLPATNHILGLADGKKRFLDLMASLTRLFALCSTLDAVQPLHKEVAFFSAIRTILLKDTTVEKKRLEEDKNSLLKQILDNAVVGEGVQDVFQLAGLEKPNIALLTPEFLDELRHLPTRNLAVELLEKLLRDSIRARTRTNIVQEKKYTDRLLESLRRYHNRAIETAEVIEELIAMAKDMQAAIAREEQLGLTEEERAFYDALAKNESAVRELGDETLKKLATELTQQLRNSTTIDWQRRESVRARIRLLIRRLLRRYKYPPDLQQEATNLVLRQAEALADYWTRGDSRIAPTNFPK